MIQTCKQRLSKLLAQYSKLRIESGEDLQFSVEDVCNLESPFWVVSDHTYASSNLSTFIPPASQRRLIELSRLCRRATEEQQLLNAESLRMVQFYSDDLARNVGMNHQWLHLQHQRCESVV